MGSQYKGSTVKDYYDAHVEDEWLRLKQDAYHMLEFIVTSHYLDKYLLMFL